MDGVGTPIIGRPRPLPRHDTPNPAYHPHTLNYEEPENLGWPPHRMDDGGSSPLTRGKRWSGCSWCFSFGLIPAHAGKTRHWRGGPGGSWAHPRSRGENVAASTSSGMRTGSSPLTRGKRFLTCTFIAQIGQILESLELCASFESYSLSDAYATDAPRDRVRSIGLAPPSSRAASSA